MVWKKNLNSYFLENIYNSIQVFNQIRLCNFSLRSLHKIEGKKSLDFYWIGRNVIWHSLCRRHNFLESRKDGCSSILSIALKKKLWPKLLLLKSFSIILLLQQPRFSRKLNRNFFLKKKMFQQKTQSNYYFLVWFYKVNIMHFTKINHYFFLSKVSLNF